MTLPRRANAKAALPRSWFPENLRLLRGDRSQTDFAEWLLVSQQTVSCWEEGTRKPSRQTWVLLEQRLGFSQIQLESAPLSVLEASDATKDEGVGHVIALPPHRGAAALHLELKDLNAEAMGVADIQRTLREALRKKRPVWLVVG